MAHSPFSHVQDAPYFETSPTLGFGSWQKYLDASGHAHWAYGIHLPKIPGLDIQITKFMVLQLVAALFVFLVMWGLSRKVRKGEPVRGRFWNFWEAIVVFLRNEVVRPTIGDGHHDHDDHGHGHGDHGHGGGEHGEHAMASVDASSSAQAAADHLAHDEAAPLADVIALPESAGGPHPADQYLPFVATLFFYILTCNLLGMIPWLGSPTGDINVTGALAVVTLVGVFFYGIQAMGVEGFAKNFCPSGVPGFLVPLIWFIEAFGLLIKHFVLAVRLFANMMAGHVVLAVFLLFIYQFATDPVTHEPLETLPILYYVVVPASVLGQVGISLLELFVAFLQSYIFAFLATLFIATVVHEH